MRFLSKVISLITLAGAAQAASWVELGQAGFQACMNNFPDRAAIASVLKADGWRFEASDGDLRVFSKEDRRVLIVNGAIRTRKEGCAVMIRKLTPEQAVSLTEQFMAQAKSVSEAKRTAGDSVKEWTATFNGLTVRFAATRQGNVAINHGAAVFMVEE